MASVPDLPIGKQGFLQLTKARPQLHQNKLVGSLYASWTTRVYFTHLFSEINILWRSHHERQQSKQTRTWSCWNWYCHPFQYTGYHQHQHEVWSLDCILTSTLPFLRQWHFTLVPTCRSNVCVRMCMYVCLCVCVHVCVQNNEWGRKTKTTQKYIHVTKDILHFKMLITTRFHWV